MPAVPRPAHARSMRTTTAPTTASVSRTDVRQAGTHDREQVVDVLTESFFDDPVTDWIIRDRSRRPAAVPPMFAIYFDLFLPHGQTYLTADGAGVALWLPPGGEMVAPHQLEDFGRRVEDALGPDAPRLIQLGEFFDAHAPSAPHWHLQLLGTRPARQGQGIGSALLDGFLAGADRRGEAAYLEATTLRSRALYERHGFVCQGEITLPDGPTLWQMWRSPRP
jgi:GNAT superfamily N-acetyltransferase